MKIKNHQDENLLPSRCFFYIRKTFELQINRQRVKSGGIILIINKV
jgi:hypothetical protein